MGAEKGDEVLISLYQAGSREGPSPQFMTQTLGVGAPSLFFRACSVGGRKEELESGQGAWAF